MMLNVASSLIRDFQSNLLDPSFCSSYSAVLKTGNIRAIREFAIESDKDMGTAEFKAVYQIQSLFKRYRFKNDLYSDKELERKAIDTFLETQSRLANVDLDSLDCKYQRVLDYAASYVAHVLGPYDDARHRDLCRFGSGASVGVSARHACEAARWELPISGSFEQTMWFDSEMSQVECVQNYWADQLGSDLLGGKPVRSVYRVVDSLKLSLVPKTFKSLRSIMPNTTIGSYQSYGLGMMIYEGLKRNGYDIRSLQKRHRYLANQGSIHQLYVTADLSSASDSITEALVRRLLPRDWFEILSSSRIRKVELPNGQIVEPYTFCTMGIGYTFPLQTLIFLSLLKAIEATLYDRNDRRTISVYGDDLIYSSRMHSEVVEHFEKYGFVMNLDKTHHLCQFRESCGGDYLRGVDVRPFQPRNGSATVGDKTYEAMLYKYVNGLLARWSEHEIGYTLEYLVSELEATCGAIKLVPSDFPDYSGVKCPSLRHWEFLNAARRAHPKHLGHGLFRFAYLGTTPKERKEKRHEPYLWMALRRQILEDHTTGFEADVQEMPRSELLELLHQTALLDRDKGRSALIEREDKPIKTFWSKFQNERLRRTSTYVAVSHTNRYTRQSGVSGFGTRS